MSIELALPCKLIGIHGHAHSGKDTVGDYLHEKYDNTWKLAFAAPLKRAAAQMFGIPEDVFFTEELKEVPDPFWGVSPRQIAQFVGTEIVRENMKLLLPNVCDNFWVLRMIHTLTGAGDSATYDEDDVVVITDVRFQNEYDWIINQGGIIICLTRPGADGAVGLSGHASESALTLHSPGKLYHITNDSTLEELYANVDHVVKQAQIYPFSNPDSF